MKQPGTVYTVKQPGTVGTVKQPGTVGTVKQPGTVGTVKQPGRVGTVKQPGTVGTVKRALKRASANSASAPLARRKVVTMCSGRHRRKPSASLVARELAS